VGDWTGVGYFFARELNARLGVPVGLINASWGGTVVEAWTSRQALVSNPAVAEVMTDWPEYINDEGWLRKLYEEFREGVVQARSAGIPQPVYFN
jgi:sialate O-acetylesterase